MRQFGAKVQQIFDIRKFFREFFCFAEYILRLLGISSIRPP